MEGGSFDLKGLAEWGVSQALGKVPSLHEMKEDILPFVGLAMQHVGIPAILEIGLAGTLLAKAVVSGMARQKAIDVQNAASRMTKEAE